MDDGTVRDIRDVKIIGHNGGNMEAIMLPDQPNLQTELSKMPDGVYTIEYLRDGNQKRSKTKYEVKKGGIVKKIGRSSMTQKENKANEVVPMYPMWNPFGMGVGYNNNNGGMNDSVFAPLMMQFGHLMTMMNQRLEQIDKNQINTMMKNFMQNPNIDTFQGFFDLFNEIVEPNKKNNPIMDTIQAIAAAMPALPHIINAFSGKAQQMTGYPQPPQYYPQQPYPQQMYGYPQQQPPQPNYGYPQQQPPQPQPNYGYPQQQPPQPQAQPTPPQMPMQQQSIYPINPETQEEVH